MSTIALWVGYVVMAATGLAIAIGACVLVMELAWRHVFRQVISSAHLRQAINDWHKNYPEQSRRYYGGGANRGEDAARNPEGNSHE